MNLQKDDPTVLKPGMTFHMPPALREYGKYGFGVSDERNGTSDEERMRGADKAARQVALQMTVADDG